MMQTVTIDATKTDLSQLLDAAAAGEEILIVRAGKPIARLMPLDTSCAHKQRRKLGRLAGKVKIPINFDDQLQNELIDLFEGR